MNISILIPCYNEAPRIKKVLKVVSKIKYIKEIIVVDDGSTDNSREVIKRYNHPKVHPIQLKKNCGK